MTEKTVTEHAFGTTERKSSAELNFWVMVTDLSEGVRTNNVLSSVINEAMGYQIIPENREYYGAEFSVISNSKKNTAVFRLKDSGIIARLVLSENGAHHSFMRKISHEIGMFADPIGNASREFEGLNIHCTLYKDDFFYGDEENAGNSIDINSLLSLKADADSESENFEILDKIALTALTNRLTRGNVLTVLYGLHNHVSTGSNVDNAEFSSLPSLIDHLDETIDYYYSRVSQVISDKDEKELRSSMMHAQKLLNDLRAEPETMLLGDSLENAAFNLNTGEMFNVNRVYRGPVVLDLVFAAYYADFVDEEEGALAMHLRNYRLQSKMVSEEQFGYNEIYVPKYIEILEIIDNLKERC